MNYYFMPRIKGLKASVTLAYYPCVDHCPSRTDPHTIYVTWSDGQHWQYRSLGNILPGEAVKITQDQLPEDCPQSASAFLFFHYKELPGQSAELITSDHMLYMPTWRGIVEIYSDHTATSYSGDYQYEMVKFVKKGTIVSTSPMLQTEDNIVNKFILVNMTLSPAVVKHSIKVVNPKQDAVLLQKDVYTNTFNVIDLAGIEVPEDTIVFNISAGLTGIPLYFSHNKDFTQMSLEHTHPPASFVQEGNTLYFQKHLKKQWLQKYATAEV